MCARCLRDGNIVVSSLIFVLGRLYITPIPSRVRAAVMDFAADPTEGRLQGLLPLLHGHQLFQQIHGVLREVEEFGGLEAVLAAADEKHGVDFQSAMAAMRGDNDDVS